MPSLIRSPLFLVLALWFAGLGSAAQFAKIVVIFPELQAHYGETGAESGYLVSFISVVGMLLGLITGVIAIQIGVRRLLLAGLWLGALISAWQATLPGFEWMLASRLVEGLSHLAIVVSAPTLIAELSARRHQGMALTLWGSYFGVAFAVIALGAPWVLGTFGLPGLPAIHAVYMAVMAALLTLALPVVDRRDVSPWPTPVEIARRHLAVYSSPFIAAPALGWLFYTLTYVSMLAILPSLLDPAARPFVTAAMPLAGIASSLTLGNLMLRRMPAVAVIVAGFCRGNRAGAGVSAHGPERLAVHRAVCRPRAGPGRKLCRRARTQCRPARPGARQWRHRPDRQYRQCARHPRAAGRHRHGCCSRPAGAADRLLQRRHRRASGNGAQPVKEAGPRTGRRVETAVRPLERAPA